MQKNKPIFFLFHWFNRFLFTITIKVTLKHILSGITSVLHCINCTTCLNNDGALFLVIRNCPSIDDVSRINQSGSGIAERYQHDILCVNQP